jgi:phosphoribosylanthranilate isomerase
VKLEIKICGITTPAALDAAAEAGADAIGFVFAPSIRHIDVSQALHLSKYSSPHLKIVAVFRNPPVDLVARVLDELPIAWVQSDVEDHALIAPHLPHGTFFRPVYRDAPDLAARVQRGSELGLNDGPVLVEGQRSGSGTVPDWPRIAALPHHLRVVLAGGLSSTNVAGAIRMVRPIGVDTSSGVESAPGVKDPGRIRAFVRAARAAEREHMTEHAP